MAAERTTQMARKTNYGYEKRQKELAKKAKKEEKRKKKLEEQEGQLQESSDGETVEEE